MQRYDLIYLLFIFIRAGMANRKNFTDRKSLEDRYQYNFFSRLKRVVWEEEYEGGGDAII